MENQRSLILHAGFSLVEFDAIKIEFTSFEFPPEVENAIFTSQNGVLAMQDGVPMNVGSKIHNCFCVGEKTKALLEKNGHKVIHSTEYASELSEYLVKNHKADFFHFFCGNIRSDEIPTKLKENNIQFEEIVVYKTTLNPKKFDRNFDAILFFSPSGVRSYFENNNPANFYSVLNPGRVELAVCIGTTTASEARNFTQNVVISNTTTVESVIAKAVKLLKE
ncbi:uroporphyrinogen-III synthase [Aequorivita ciconiae]|uniref:uroporphyrinogen-III synthase n=1 Tax=Aequorivita ciconiae TaxID=2494375 RepID=UPI001F0B8280|nr:uroporphyrinogen-III synthase [Aequorivita sp. H23M31]